jgi:putative transposase
MRAPAVHGFGEDQRWTLARVSDLIPQMFHARYALRGTAYLLHRMGFSVQVRNIGRPSGTKTRS